LKESSELRSQNKRKVYIGNDCFGRNTYGGGKFDIFVAANKILEYKNQLSIGLFAPAFTY
jgi:mannosyl-glycoprotein endo-beta-N-acetylglucosaminidase